MRRVPQAVPGRTELAARGASAAGESLLRWRVIRGALFALAAFALSNSAQAAEPEVARGEYIFCAAGCASCHTDVAGGGPELAGGRALNTSFGVFRTPNITPDTETGIGEWSDEEFLRALREGLRPDGSHYFPAFPYTSYTRMTAEDARALKAYLFSRPAVSRRNQPHDLEPPFGWRFLLSGWKLLFLEQGPFEPDPERSAEWNRGAYLVTALGHCGECHTVRNVMGAQRASKALAGNAEGPDGRSVPNITPHRETGIGGWSEADIVMLLKTGLKPNFDNVQGAMAEAIDDGLKYLTDDDLQAVATYLRALDPIDNKVSTGR